MRKLFSISNPLVVGVRWLCGFQGHYACCAMTLMSFTSDSNSVHRLSMKEVKPELTDTR